MMESGRKDRSRGFLEAIDELARRMRRALQEEEEVKSSGGREVFWRKLYPWASSTYTRVNASGSSSQYVKCSNCGSNVKAYFGDGARIIKRCSMCGVTCRCSERVSSEESLAPLASGHYPFSRWAEEGKVQENPFGSYIKCSQCLLRHVPVKEIFESKECPACGWEGEEEPDVKGSDLGEVYQEGLKEIKKEIDEGQMGGGPSDVEGVPVEGEEDGYRSRYLWAKTKVLKIWNGEEYLELTCGQCEGFFMLFRHHIERPEITMCPHCHWCPSSPRAAEFPRSVDEEVKDFGDEKPDQTFLKYRMKDDSRQIGLKGRRVVKVYRIVALKDIPEHGVKAGDLGGWIGHGENLSHLGTCWVGGEAVVAEEARVDKDALVKGESGVSGSARVTDHVVVHGSALIQDSAALFERVRVCDFAVVGGEAMVKGHARIEGSALVCGNSKVGGRAWIHQAAVVKGHAEVSGFAEICGDSKVCGSSKIEGTNKTEPAE